MRCGLYGKLPAKRDFVAVAAPRPFLNIWEPWMQGGISASRQSLGKDWQEAFLTAPIWRFWLGADLCGATVIGAFMPSLDGIGRYFPLTLFACADEGAAIAPPELDPQDEWFETAENFLLSTLEPDATFEAASAQLERLPPPSDRAPPARSETMVALPQGVVAMARFRPLNELFESIRVADHVSAYAAASFWWTIGGKGFEPLAMSGRRMPDPFLFTEMLTGRFGFGFE
jgi:type VI secretion system protein ImpM